MAEISINWKNKIGTVKPMHGVGQPPINGIDCSMFKYLKEAGIPYSRLHDVGGYHGQNRFVDIPNIFRDFDANPEDPKSYDFTFTDCLIKGLIDNNVLHFDGNVTVCKTIGERLFTENPSLPFAIKRESVLCIWVDLLPEL